MWTSSYSDFWVATGIPVIDTVLITPLCIALSHWFKPTLFSTLSFHSNIVDLRIAAQLGSLWDSVTQTYILRTAGPTLVRLPLCQFWLQPPGHKTLVCHLLWVLLRCACGIYVCMSHKYVAHDNPKGSRSSSAMDWHPDPHISVGGSASPGCAVRAQTQGGRSTKNLLSISMCGSWKKSFKIIPSKKVILSTVSKIKHCPLSLFLQSPGPSKDQSDR